MKFFMVDGAAPTEDVKLGIPMCTPYTEMIRVRDEALAAADLSKMRVVEAGVKSDAAEVERNAACSSMVKMQRKMGDMEAAMMQLVKSCESQVAAEKKQRDADVQSIIAQHNLQLSELKRLHKAIAAKQSASAAAALSIVSASTTRESPVPPAETAACTAVGVGVGAGAGTGTGGTGVAPSQPFRAVHGAALHTTSVPHPAQHSSSNSNRSSTATPKGHATSIAPHTGHSNEITRSTSHAAVHHPTPSTYSTTTATLHHGASSHQQVKPHSRSEQQQPSSESTTQGFEGPHGATSSKSHRVLEHAVPHTDGGALGSEHTIRGSLSLPGVSESYDESDMNVDNKSLSASRQTQTEGYLQPTLSMHLSPHESRSGKRGIRTLGPSTTDTTVRTNCLLPTLHQALKTVSMHLANTTCCLPLNTTLTSSTTPPSCRTLMDMATITTLPTRISTTLMTLPLIPRSLGRHYQRGWSQVRVALEIILTICIRVTGATSSARRDSSQTSWI
jgi:hypothetical protein